MSYTLLTDKKSPNFTPNNRVQATWGVPRTFKEISIHWWGDPATNPTFEGVISTLCNSTRQASAHYVATGTGRRVARLVNEQDASWATNSANPWTISIECDPRCRNEDYSVVSELIRDIRNRHGDLPLVPHKKYANTQCPGNWDLNRLDTLIRKHMIHRANIRFDGSAPVYGIYEFENMEEVHATGKDINLWAPARLERQYDNPEVSLCAGINSFESVAFLGLHPEDTKDNYDKKEIKILSKKVTDLEKKLKQEELLHDDTARSAKEIIATLDDEMQGLNIQVLDLQAKLEAYKKPKPVEVSYTGSVDLTEKDIKSFTTKIIEFIRKLLKK